MTAEFRNTALAYALLTLSATAAAQGEAIEIEPGTDDIGVDFYQQNDRYTSALNRPQSTTGFYERQVQWELDNDYPMASIIMSSVARGMTIADAAYFIAKARPERAQELRDLAVDIMPTMPGWACSSDAGVPNRYPRELRPQDLSPTTTLAQLSSLYFERGQRFMEYPSWEKNQGHADISIDELIQFKQAEMDATGVDSWWYRPDDRVKTDVQVVSLYPEEQRVVIDARMDELQALKKRGAVSLPVMLLYAEMGQIPMSDFDRDPTPCEDAEREEDTQLCEFRKAQAIGNDQALYIDYDDGEITASEVLGRFNSSGERVSPTRDWHKGDHHLRVKVDELEALFDIPEKDDVPPEQWQKWERHLEQGLDNPLMISLYKGTGEDHWLDERVLVAVAAEKQVERLPVVFFYHANQRQACGLPAACIPIIEQAISSGSGRFDLPFGGKNPWNPGLDGGTGPKPSPNVPGIIPPPPPPPSSPS